MKTITTLLLFILLAISASAQYNELRYREAIFNAVTVQNNVTYAESPQWVFPYWNTTLKLNVYQPTGDVVNKRPLIIFAHAGGFINGSKDVDDMVALCDSFARKGYVTATIDYRKGFNPADAESAERAVYRGVQDGKAAVRFFKEKANLYGIDTSYIYFGGMSAGGFIALHAAYMNLESERPASTYGGGTVNNLGCLDCVGNSYGHSSKVRAILNYWGAIVDTNFIAAGDVPVMSMHGSTDPTVPYSYGQPFGLGTLPYVFGSVPVTARVNNLGIYNEFYTSNSPNVHMLDGSDNGTFDGGPSAFWYDTLLPRTTDFLVKMTKSNPIKISPDVVVACHNTTTTLKISGMTGAYKRWYFNPSDVSNVVNNNTDSIQFSFNNPGAYQVGVVEFNEVYCASDTLWFTVIQEGPLAVDFVAAPGNNNEISFSSITAPNVSYHWDFGDGTTSALANPTHTYATNGTFNVVLTITSANGCVNTKDKTVTISPLSVNTEELVDVKIYPVPFNYKLKIEWGEASVSAVKVMDLHGRLITTELVEFGKDVVELNTSMWGAGVYVVALIDTDGLTHQYQVVK